MSIFHTLAVNVMVLLACVSLLPDGIGAEGSRKAVARIGDGAPSRPHDAALELNLSSVGSNPCATIEYSFTSDSTRVPVRLSVLAPDGRRLLTLVDEPLAPGQYCFFWQGITGQGKLPGRGVYLCRLDAGHMTTTRRFEIGR